MLNIFLLFANSGQQKASALLKIKSLFTIKKLKIKNLFAIKKLEIKSPFAIKKPVLCSKLKASK